MKISLPPSTYASVSLAKVELKRTRVNVEGINRAKKDGSKVNVWFNPSKVLITEMHDDKKRLKRLNMEKLKETKDKKTQEENKTMGGENAP